MVNRVWSDHTDIRPTLLSLVGLQDDYISDGRVLSEVLRDNVLPRSLREGDDFRELAQIYKQINAPLGDFGMDALRISTSALADDDQTYSALEAQISDITAQRNTIANQMRQVLNDAEFSGKRPNQHTVKTLIGQGRQLLREVDAVAAALSRTSRRNGND